MLTETHHAAAVTASLRAGVKPACPDRASICRAYLGACMRVQCLVARMLGNRGAIVADARSKLLSLRRLQLLTGQLECAQEHS